MQHLSTLFIYGGMSVLLTMVSGSIPLIKGWKEDHLHNFVSFSAGTLLATAFINILPDAADLLAVQHVGLLALIAFALLFVLERFIMLHPCEETHCDYHTMGLAAYVGMLIHTFMDGLALGAAMMVEGLAWIIFFAIIVHKIPSAFALSSILRKGEWAISKILVGLLIFSLAIPLGTLTSLLILSPITTQATGVALALSLGTFIYIATSDFLPEVHREGTHRIKNLLSFFIGIILVVGTNQLFLHGH